jgi:glyoxylase-like metal-dependent hydrolase (beta-lactamase superfamily II)
MKITSHIHLVGSGRMGFGLSHAEDCNVFLVNGGKEMALIDAGSGLDTQSILNNIQNDDLDIKKIKSVLVTHYHMDHAGGLNQLHSQFNSRIYASIDSAPSIRTGDEAMTGLTLGKSLGWFPPAYHLDPCEVTDELRGGEVISVGNLKLKVLATPGHCQGHLSFLLEDEGQRFLFSGDVIFALGRVLLEYMPGADMWQYQQTIFMLEKLDFEGIFPGHNSFNLKYGKTFVTSAAEQMRAAHIPGNLL